jgi:hypothetical protein
MVPKPESIGSEIALKGKYMLIKSKKIVGLLLGMAILLPTFFGIVCTKLNVIPKNSLDSQVYGAALLPEQLSRASSIQLFAIALICAMIIITAILTVIALSKRISNRDSSK